MSDDYRVRASSWGSLFDCAHKWEWEHLLGHKRPAGVRALLGTSLHKSTAVFDASRMDGTGLLPDDAADALVDTLRNPQFDVDYRQDDLTVDQAERIGLPLHARYCTSVSPRFEFTSVEMALDPMSINCGGGVNVVLTGTMDRGRSARTTTGTIIPDIKSGSRVISNGVASIKGRSAQLGVYELLYEHKTHERTVGAQVIALSTGGTGDVKVSEVFDARRVMVGVGDSPGLIEFAADMFRTGLFPPNPSSTLCSKRYCARWSTCIFHE
jgi:hypothetical protein